MRHGLRDLSKRIRELATTHPYGSQAASILANCADNIDMLARTHEANDEIQSLKSYIAGAKHHE